MGGKKCFIFARMGLGRQQHRPVADLPAQFGQGFLGRVIDNLENKVRGASFEAFGCLQLMHDLEGWVQTEAR